MTTLIALNTDYKSRKSRGSHPSDFPDKKADFQFWNELLSPFNLPGESEVAIFLPGILGIDDGFKADFRRFSVVGKEAEDQIRNVFELGFEKGFDQVIVVNESWYSASSESIKKILESLIQAKIAFIPDEDGSLLVWGMKKNLFWNWPRFDSFSKEAVVEMMSMCLENNTKYALIHPL